MTTLKGRRGRTSLVLPRAPRTLVTPRPLQPGWEWGGGSFVGGRWCVLDILIAACRHVHYPHHCRSSLILFVRAFIHSLCSLYCIQFIRSAFCALQPPSHCPRCITITGQTARSLLERFIHAWIFFRRNNLAEHQIIYSYSARAVCMPRVLGLYVLLALIYFLSILGIGGTIKQ